jgi:hypothetical protein
MSLFGKFWAWYERHYRITLIVTTLLFLLQLFHLYWLFSDVIMTKLTGRSYFLLAPVWGHVSIIFDYSEIPALLSTSVLYIHYLRQKFTYKNLIYLLYLNIQWIHLFWITDSFVVEKFHSNTSIIHWSNTLAWVAILIDYLELPVIFDTVRQTLKVWKNKLTHQS